MKIFKTLIFLAVFSLILLFIGTFVYVKIYGKGIIEESLKKSLNKNVTLERIDYQFPFSLKAKNLRITHLPNKDQYFHTKEIYTRISPESIVQRRIIFDIVELTESKEIIDIQKDLRWNRDQLPHQATQEVSSKDSNHLEDKKVLSSQEASRKTDTEIVIKKLVFKKGHVQYTNKSIDRDFSVALENVHFEATNLSIPMNEGRSEFHGSGRLIKKGNPLSGSMVESSGWVDIVRRDMEAKVLVTETDGSVGMTAQAISRNNDMEVKGDVKFQNIFMGAGKQNASGGVNDMIANALSSAGVEIGAQFSFKTKMDNFRPEQVSFSGNVLTK